MLKQDSKVSQQWSIQVLCSWLVCSPARMNILLDHEECVRYFQSSLWIILFHRSSLCILANLLFVPTHIYSLRELGGQLLPLTFFFFSTNFLETGLSHETSSKIRSNNNILQMEIFQKAVRLVKYWWYSGKSFIRDFKLTCSLRCLQHCWFTD